MKQEPVLFTIAGTDPLCGAGCAADLATFHAHGWTGVAVETSLVTQDSHGVQAVFVSPLDSFRPRLMAVWNDCSVHGMKMGLMGDPLLVRAVSSCLATMRDRPVVVLDPVGVSGDGEHALFQGDLREAFHDLLPYVDVLTPNRLELEAMSGIPVRSRDDAARAARVLHARGVYAVLIKGGHLEPFGVDALSIRDEGVQPVFQGKPWPVDVHGTGCHLSSAITANLADGMPIVEAVAKASAWLHNLVAEHAFVYVGRGRPQFDPRRLCLGLPHRHDASVRLTSKRHPWR